MDLTAITVILLTPFLLAVLAFAGWMVMTFRNDAHRRTMERLQVEAAIYRIPADQNGNYEAIYLPSEQRFIVPEPGQSGPTFPALTHYHHAPHESVILHGKPLNVGSQDQRRLIIRSWQNNPAELFAQTAQEAPGAALEDGEVLEDQPAGELPAPESELTPEQAVLGLLQQGISIREASRVTGVTFYRARELAKDLSSND